MVVPLAQLQGELKEGIFLEGGKFVGIHFAALQLEALCRGWRKLLEVFGMDGALVALGVHVQPDGLGDLGAEVAGQLIFANALVATINALFGDILGQSMQEMPDVVQQRRGHQRVGRLVLFSQLGGLECVLQFRDSLAIG